MKFTRLVFKKFGPDLPDGNSRINFRRIAQEAGLIRVADPDHPRAGYVPHWA